MLNTENTGSSPSRRTRHISTRAARPTAAALIALSMLAPGLLAVQAKAATNAKPFVDPRTGLMWAAEDNGKPLTWAGAARYCATKTSEGFTDWRLASITELSAMYVDKPTALLQRGTRPSKIAGGITLSKPGVWSGSVRNDKTGEVWLYDFGGVLHGAEARKTDTGGVALCVRDGRRPSSAATVSATGFAGTSQPYENGTMPDRPQAGTAGTNTQRSRTGPDEIRVAALKELTDNAAKFREILFTEEDRSQVVPQCIFAPCAPPTPSGPVLRSHYEIINDQKALVYDGWSDDPVPLAKRVPGLEDRIAKFGPKYAYFDAEDFLTYMLKSGHSFQFAGGRMAGGRLLYGLQATPQPSPSTPVGMARCAEAAKGTIYIDRATMFPALFEFSFVAPNSCNLPVGTKVIGEFILASGKDDCGKRHDIHVIKQVDTISPFNATTRLTHPNSVVQRVLPGGTGEVHHVSTKSNIKVFVTGACLKSELVELVDTKISYGEIVK